MMRCNCKACLVSRRAHAMELCGMVGIAILGILTLALVLR